MHESDQAETLEGLIHEQNKSSVSTFDLDEWAKFELEMHRSLYSRLIGGNSIPRDTPDLSYEEVVLYLSQNHSQLDLHADEDSENPLTNKIAQPIADNQFLTSLNLAHNALDDEGLQILAKSKSITELDISGNKFSSKGLKNLFQNGVLKKLTACPTYYASFDSYINVVEIDGCEPYDGTQSSITSLDLSMQRIANDGLQFIAKNQSINSLFLSECGITDEGAKILINLKKLLVLYIGGCKITDEGAKILADSKNLLELNISGEMIEDEIEDEDGVIYDVIVPNGKITDEGAMAFLSNQKLIRLEISGHQISENCLKLLQEHIAKNRACYEKEIAVQKSFQWGSKLGFFTNGQQQSLKNTFAPDIQIFCQ